MENRRLIQIRASKKIRQDHLSKDLGFGYNYVSRVENGITKGSVEFWNAIQNYFEIPDEEMWGIINGKEN